MTIELLCKETIAHYRQRFFLIHEGHVWNTLTDLEFLKKIGAAKINPDNGKAYPTAAGLLMFGYESEIVYVTEDVKKPFVLDGITRVDNTPTHKAIREILFLY